MTDAQTLTLAEFLLARIADEEPAARAAGGIWLAECEAKRWIVEPWTGDDSDEYSSHDEDNWRYGIHADAHERVLRILATPYAGHPDYREEWRP